MFVEECEEFIVRDLISCRDIVEQENSKEIFENLSKYVVSKNINCAKEFSISVTHNVINKNNNVFLDLELMWKLDTPIIVDGHNIKYIKEFKIINVIKCVTDGTSEQIIMADALFKEYLNNNKTKAVTPCYIVTETNDNKGINVTIYVGICEK